MRHAFPTGWTFLVITALILTQTHLSPTSFAAESESDAPVTLEQCRDQLLSGEFAVMDLRKDNRVLPGVARQFAKIIEEMIEKRNPEKSPEKSKDRFDRARGNLLERIIDGRWGMNETSDDILTDCFFAVHPDADVEN